MKALIVLAIVAIVCVIGAMVALGLFSPSCDERYRLAVDQFGNYEIQERHLISWVWLQNEQIPKERQEKWGWGKTRLKEKIAECECDRNPIKHEWSPVNEKANR